MNSTPSNIFLMLLLSERSLKQSKTVLTASDVHGLNLIP